MRRICALTCLRIAVVVGPTMSCFGRADYHCNEDAECRWGERVGVCEATTHYCSYPDAECPSGAVYSDQAGELAGHCVDAPVADDTGSSGASTTSSATTGDATTGADATTFAPQPICGNEVPEAGELCDDGNDVDGDGCNVDCVPSGSPRWDPVDRVHTGAADADALFWDVDVRPDDTIIAVGLEEVVDGDALFVLFDGDGNTVWARRYAHGGVGSDVARAVSSAVGSEIYVVGSSPNPTQQAGWLAVVEPADGDVESIVWTEQPLVSDLAHMHPSRLIVGGHANALVGARAFTDMLALDWIAEAAIAEAGIAAVAADGVRDIAYAGGQFSGTARIVQLVPGDPEPLVTLFDGPEGSGVQSLVFGDGALVVGGYVGLGMRDGWVQRLTPTGRDVWSWSSADVGEEEVEDVAIAPTGHVVAVGFTTGHAQDARVWKLTPEGELAWTWSWDEPFADDDVARGVAVRADGDIVVVGGRTADDGATDAWVVRLTP